MTDLVICSLANAFRIYLIRKLILIFVDGTDKEINKTKEILMFSLFFFINTVLYLRLRISWVNMLCNIIGIYLLSGLYTKSTKMKCFLTCSSYLINMGCDIVGTVLVMNYEEGKMVRQTFQIIIVFLISICVLVVERIVSYREKNNDVKSLPLMLVPLSSIVIICMVFYREKDISTNGIIIICIGLLVINMLIFYLYNLLLKSITEKYENEILKQKVQIYSNQLDVIMKSEERIRSLRHDLKHHINELKILANKYEMAEVDDYLKSMQSYIEDSKVIVDSGNREIDSLLNYMLVKAKNQLNTVQINVQLPEKLVHSFDIVVLLGNLLENAIEAAEKTEEKFLDVVILYKKGIVKIEIKNSFLAAETVLDKNGRYITTKKNKNMHGIGLNSIEKIVEKYDGLLDINQEEKYFCTKLVLYWE